MESRIKTQIEMDKRVNSNTSNHEPILVTSKNDPIGGQETTPDSTPTFDIAHEEPSNTTTDSRAERTPVKHLNLHLKKNEEMPTKLSSPRDLKYGKQQSQVKPSEITKSEPQIPLRNVPSKRLEELLYQKKKIDSPRTEKGLYFNNHFINNVSRISFINCGKVYERSVFKGFLLKLKSTCCE